MKVKELIEILTTVDPEEDVLLAIDSEGNRYHLLSEVSVNQYKWDGDYNAEVGIRELTPELQAQNYSEEDVYGDKPCVILWPN